jgi:uncharacterized repeat protein (TIGR03803 family)
MKSRLILFFQLFLAVAVLLSIVPLPRMQAQTFSVIHYFTGGADGGSPLNGLFLSSTGEMYGTASSGGKYGSGVVFKVNTSGKESVLYAFTGGADGASPESFLIEDQSGNFYGTAYGGGASGAGTVFMITGTKETVLYSFGSQTNDGSAPEAGLAFDSAGNLYGTTTTGGIYGGGTVFQLVPTGSGSWTENILYNFGSGTDGSDPVAGVTLDASGNLYGTTAKGGAYGYGRVFELAQANSWAETVIHDFANLDDGATPYAGLVPGPSGVFYGAATADGSEGGGTIFQLTPSAGSWNFSVIHSLTGWGIAGSFRNLLVDSKGTIYATTHCDGADELGTVYQLVPSNGKWNYKLLFTFTNTSEDGYYEFSNLVLKGGKLYGTSNVGGTYGSGGIFEVTP